MEIIVDLFNQHSGKPEDLKRMAMTAWQCGADTVKIQLLNSRKIWGDDSREYLELSESQFMSFVEFCDKNFIPWLATPFEWKHIQWLEQVEKKRYKLSSWSAKNDVEFCKEVIAYATSHIETAFSIPREVIVSLGLVDGFPFGARENIKYLFCVSEYPTLLDNEKNAKMPMRFDSQDSNYTGYSDHTPGIAAAIEAYRRGAKIIEKHFTLNAARQSSTEKAHFGSFTPESLRVFSNIISEYEASHGLV